MADSRYRLTHPVPSTLLMNNELSIDDVYVLHGLCQGWENKAIASYSEISERNVNDRIKYMKDIGIIEKLKYPLINIDRLWNHLYMGQIKLQLAAPINIQATPLLRSPPAWGEILNIIKSSRVKETFQELVRFAMVPFGTEYDLIMIVTAQSLDEYSRFFVNLQKEVNIDRVWGSEAVPLAGIHFNPISVPDPKQIENSVGEVLDSKLIQSFSARKRRKKRVE